MQQLLARSSALLLIRYTKRPSYHFVLAVQRRLPGEGLLAHSDRGSQYASDHYQRLLAGERSRHSSRFRGSGIE